MMKNEKWKFNKESKLILYVSRSYDWDCTIWIRSWAANHILCLWIGFSLWPTFPQTFAYVTPTAWFHIDFNTNANWAPIMKITEVCGQLSSEFSMEVSLSLWSVWWTPASVKSGIMTSVCEEKPSVKTWDSQGERCERKAWMDQFNYRVCEARDRTDRNLHCCSVFTDSRSEDFIHLIFHTHIIVKQVKWPVIPVSTGHTLKLFILLAAIPFPLGWGYGCFSYDGTALILKVDVVLVLVSHKVWSTLQLFLIKNCPHWQQDGLFKQQLQCVGFVECLKEGKYEIGYNHGMSSRRCLVYLLPSVSNWTISPMCLTLMVLITPL